MPLATPTAHPKRHPVWVTLLALALLLALPFLLLFNPEGCRFGNLHFGASIVNSQQLFGVVPRPGFDHFPINFKEVRLGSKLYHSSSGQPFPAHYYRLGIGSYLVAFQWVDLAKAKYGPVPQVRSSPVKRPAKTLPLSQLRNRVDFRLVWVKPKEKGVLTRSELLWVDLRREKDPSFSQFPARQVACLYYSHPSGTHFGIVQMRHWSGASPMENLQLVIGQGYFDIEERPGQSLHAGTLGDTDYVFWTLDMDENEIAEVQRGLELESLAPK